MNTLIFCYGTLKSGYSNHGLIHESEFVGRATTINKYTMYSNGNFPYVCYLEDEDNYTISGEVYKVSPETLQRVDRLEGHPTFYHRKPIMVELESGEQIIAEIYFNNKPMGWKLETGEF